MMNVMASLMFLAGMLLGVALCGAYVGWGLARLFLEEEYRTQAEDWRRWDSPSLN